MTILKAFMWGTHDNELREMTRERFLDELRECAAAGWPIKALHDDGVLEFEGGMRPCGEFHSGFALYAKSMEEAHAKLLKHATYLEINETEADGEEDVWPTAYEERRNGE